MVHTPLIRQRRTLTIVAQDPDVKDAHGRILTTQVDVPDEHLDDGPCGYRVHVIDYDASTGKLYRPLLASAYRDRRDPFADPKDHSDDTILGDPRFHAQNTYAIAMRILMRFESALGRRVAWSFNGHQLKIAPHAFADANAFYSKRDSGLLFGYFAPRKGAQTVFTALSHDIVAHETTHALLDGLRERYIDPSSPDQAGFHEGFSDTIALLSVFASREIVATLIDASGPRPKDSDRISLKAISSETIAKSSLLGLADQMGKHMAGARVNALRRSILLDPAKVRSDPTAYAEPHDRGEILVAAMTRTFVHAWLARLASLDKDKRGTLDRNRVVEEGCAAADTLLTMAIRALDYLPPTDLHFSDYVSALLTSDYEARPDDSRFGYRALLRRIFADYGVTTTSRTTDGRWEPPDAEVAYESTHFEALQRDPEEVFRFVWQNRVELGLDPSAFTRVISVRPALRVSTDGFVLRETVAEYLQQIDLTSGELFDHGVRRPHGMPADQPLTLYGGGTLIFDDFGRLKFHLRNKINNDERQSARLEYLHESGFFSARNAAQRTFAAVHRQRLLHERRFQEAW